MSNTPNPNKKPTRRRDVMWRRGGRVWTWRGSMSIADYELLRTARPDVLPRVADLPTRAELGS